MKNPCENKLWGIAGFFKVFMLLAAAACFAGRAGANNLMITNPAITRGGSAVEVAFDISWDNSWRDAENHDAVWIFLKYSSDGGSTWGHGTLLNDGTNPHCTYRGTAEAGMEIIVPQDKKGAFLQRSSTNTGGGTFSSEGVELSWDYGGDGLSPEEAALSVVRIMGIEMVYIPQGGFRLGDGEGFPEDVEQLFDLENTWVDWNLPVDKHKTHDGTHQAFIGPGTGFNLVTGIYEDIDPPKYMSYDDKIMHLILDICLDTLEIEGFDWNEGVWVGWNGADFGISRDSGEAQNMNYDFPLGYHAFYMMRYPVSQGQYRDFLNTLTPAQQAARYGGDELDEGGREARRYGIYVDEDHLAYCDLNGNEVFDEEDDGQWILNSFASPDDAAAYLAWAALRPVTEMEYEKAARGPVEELFAKAWGTESIVIPTGYDSPGSADEAPENAGANAAFGIESLGPPRVGAFAYEESNRISSGAGYYGVMDLSGGVPEYTVSFGTKLGRSFEGKHGSGELAAAGGADYDALTWPGGVVPTDSRDFSEDRGISRRGGHWADSGAQAVLLRAGVRDKLGGANYQYRSSGPEPGDGYDYRGDIGGAAGGTGIRAGRTAPQF